MKLVSIFIGVSLLIIIVLTVLSSSGVKNASSFNVISDSYNIGGDSYDVIYDSGTEIVYLGHSRLKGNDTTAMYNSVGTPMTLDEYKSTMQQVTGVNSRNRFIETEYTYYINGGTYNVFYDYLTDIVYLCDERLYGNDVTVLFNSGGKATTFKEYEKSIQQ